MPNDILGVKELYPGKKDPNHKDWFMSKNDWFDDPRVRMDENVSGNLTDGFRLDDDSAVRISISAEPKDSDIECDVNFAEAEKRGWTFKNTDWLNVEQTAYWKVIEIDEDEDNELIMKGPTGEHHSNTDCCTGSAYNVRIGLENPINTEFSKEMWHVAYYSKLLKNISGENYSVIGHGWFGVKFVNYVRVKDNVKTRVLEHWLNPNADKQTWKLINKTEDTGKWGSRGDKCGGKVDQKLTFGNARQMWRWDHGGDANIRFKWFSVREIDPFQSFDPDPVNPPTNNTAVTKFVTHLKLRWHINYDDGPGCGPGGLTLVYQIEMDTPNPIERKLADDSNHDFRTRVGQVANSSGSSLVGKIPKMFMAHLRKVGSPSGNVDARIYNSSGTLKATSSSVTASSLPATFDQTMTEFDFSGNTYTMAYNDKIVVQYTGTDPDNCIAIECSDPGDGSTATCYTYYNDNTTVWGKITLRDCHCQVWA